MVCPQCERPSAHRQQRWRDTEMNKAYLLFSFVFFKSFWTASLSIKRLLEDRLSKCTLVSTAASGLLSGPTISSSTVTCFFSDLREAEERRVKMGKALAMAQAEANTSERSHTIWKCRAKAEQQSHYTF